MDHWIMLKAIKYHQYAKILKNLYWNTTTIIRINTETNKTKIKRRMWQVNKISPKQFTLGNMYLKNGTNRIIEELKERLTNLRFADHIRR